MWNEGGKTDGMVRPQRILLLGGTTEASALVRRLAAMQERFAVTLSLAGRTTEPRREPVPTRIGGFGGVEGLAAFLAEHRIMRVIDATHPFAASISHNAASACRAMAVPLLAVRRPAWDRQPGDHWIEVDDMAAAAVALGEAPRRVFLTIGRQELAAFASAPQHDYIARTIEPPDITLPRLHAVAARGPFSKVAEAAFLREAEIDVLVTKNSGGEATYAKIEAARDLGLPVVIVRRPPMPAVAAVPDADAALARLLQLGEGTLRGV